MKKRIITKLAQKFADTIASQYKITADPNIQNILLDQAAKLNAYCIVFHAIYLD